MKRTHFFLGVVMVLGVIFELFPDQSLDSPKYDLWLFFDPVSNGEDWGGLSWQQYAYFTMEHLSLMVLALLIYLETRRDKIALLFFGIQCAQLVDFWMTYNTTWFNIGKIPVTMNLVQIVVFTLAVFHHVGGSRDDTYV